MEIEENQNLMLEKVIKFTREETILKFGSSRDKWESSTKYKIIQQEI